jgi:hypothetical protein
MTHVRTLGLRQAVVVAADRDAVVAQWQRHFGLGAPFHDPGVESFGLSNAVLPVGDRFLEVVSPLVPGGGSAGERHMARHGGDCGYMAIFQVADIDDARRHLRSCGARSVLDIDLDDIRATHVHPADIGAAIVSFDEPRPPAAWRWAGPDWTDEIRTSVVDGLAGIVIADRRPDALLERWAAVLDLEPAGDELVLPDDSTVRVVGASGADPVGLVGIDLWAAPDTDPFDVDCAGVTFRVVRRSR